VVVLEHREKYFCVATQRCIRSVGSAGMQNGRLDCLHTQFGPSSTLERKTDNSSFYRRTTCVRTLLRAVRLLPTQCNFAFSVGTQNGRLAFVSTHGFRSNATPHGASTTNSVWFRVFCWNARRTISSTIHALLPFERYSLRRVYYQRSAVGRFPLERTTDN
jgi:hypothetical protein